jgi:sulfonate transport system substrate-binding protein
VRAVKLAEQRPNGNQANSRSAVGSRVSDVLLFAVLWGVCECSLSGCGKPASADLGSPHTSSASSAELRIGYQKSSVLFNLLRVRKVLESRLGGRVKVTWQEFPAGPQLLEGLNVGSLDVGFTGEVPPIFAQAAGAPLVYVLAERAGPATEAILVRRDAPYKTVAELKGKRVALNKGSNVHYLLARALEKAGLYFSDIDPVFLPPADARAAFDSGRVDAWAIWDPYYSQVVDTGEARVLSDGSGLVENRGYYVATRQFVNEQPETLRVLLAELRTMNSWSEAHRDEVADFLANLLEIEPRVMRVVEQRRKFGVDAIGPEIVAYQQNIADTFLHLGLIPQSVRVEEAVWTPERN